MEAMDINGISSKMVLIAVQDNNLTYHLIEPKKRYEKHDEIK